jgi:hypothetical protein
MKFWQLVVIALLAWLIFGDKKQSSDQPGGIRNNVHYSHTYERFNSPSHASGNSADRPDGEYDCTVTNITRGTGPYSLECEKDGDDLTIRFPNGGYIVVDSDGFHAARGEQWEVELE